AQTLRARGIGPGHTVAILSDRTPALVYGLLGVLRSGAAFHILDAAYPSARLLSCVQQSRPDYLLISGDLPLAGLGLSAERVLRLPSEVGAVRAALAHASMPPAHGPSHATFAPEQTAYITFTSGSTGIPKGVVTSHAPLAHFIGWHVAHGQLVASDRFSMLSGLSHDPLLRDVFTPLSIGASLHIPTQSTLFDADALFAWFEAQRITVAHLTPAFGEILLAGCAADSRLTALRRLYWGGDVLTLKLARSMAQLAPRAEQTNFYGATETPQAMAYFDLRELGSPLAEQGAVPLGRGIEGAQLLVLNQEHRLCAPGELGELWIRSPYLSKGYLDAASTQARFVPNPYTQVPGDLCYRTGDQGRYLASGAVCFAGRIDHQLKLRGVRIEPAEISAPLEQFPGVRRVLVSTFELHGDKHLVVYVAHGSAPAPAVTALRERLQTHLPSSMVPQFIVVLREFPLLPNGKVDLLSLPTPTRAPGAGTTHGESRAARSEAERALAALWADLLGVSEVGIDQSFLDLGGDSLSAIRALSRMRRLGIAEHVARGIFQGRTIAELANAQQTGESSPSSGHLSQQTARTSPAGATNTTLLINVVRGFLVLTLVADHWRDGFFKRFPSLPRALVHAIEPLFDAPTPGFAFVFGVGLAYSQYANYLRNPGASARSLRGGAWVLAAGTLLMGLSRNLGVVARGLPLDYDLFCTNFFLPTLYYALALGTASLWFAAVARREGKPGGSLLAALLLALACRGSYELCRLLLLPHEQVGLLQLGRLMLTARFSYFNLSTGALLGMAFGLQLRRVGPQQRLLGPLAGTGLLMLATGFLLSYAQRELHPDSLTSADLPLPKWFVYIGATLWLSASFELTLRFADRRRLRSALEWLGVVGQCAMPIFILQGVALDLSAFGRALGLPDKVATALALLAFIAVVGELMRRIHGLYYGPIHAPHERSKDSRSTLPA
ncbi:MAG: amino acid adenylation enzyme/thioester reductase family protein, partial [Myxococcaceae bacterium]|nr:amino acid adenylation enzyme/thioester reductase family protein [Myxococcaceae bacterium]